MLELIILNVFRLLQKAQEKNLQKPVLSLSQEQTFCPALLNNSKQKHSRRPQGALISWLFYSLSVRAKDKKP